MSPGSKTVLVTGAAGGLGRAIAECLAGRGDSVFAADVDQAGLLPLAGVTGVTTLPLDITSAESVRDAVDQVRARGGLDGLVNCAGVFAGGPLVEIPVEEVRRALEVNVLGMVRVTRACFPLLRERRGRVVNISSESGRFVAPFIGPYCMSKFAVEAYSDALRRELMFLDMAVVVIQPGPVRTPFLGVPPTTFARCADGSCFQAPLRQGQRWAAREVNRACSPQAVARVVYRALHARRPRPRYRVRNNLGRALLEMLPATWVDALLRRAI